MSITQGWRCFVCASFAGAGVVWLLSLFLRHKSVPYSSSSSTTTDNDVVEEGRMTAPRHQQSSSSLYRDEIERVFPFKHVEYDHDRDLQFGSLWGTNYEPIRIRFDTRLIEQRLGENAVMDAEIDFIVNDILPEAAATWSQHLSVRPVLSGLTVGSTDCGASFVDRLPDGDVDFPDADLVIVVSGDVAGPCASSPATLAFAFVCQLDTVLNRPLVGAVNYCLENDVAGSTTKELPSILGVDIVDFYGPWTRATYRGEHLSSGLLETTVHELAHILGQTSFLFAFFHDENGAPRTPRDSTGFPIFSTRQCGNGTVVNGLLPSEDTVKVVGFSDGRFQHFLVTPRVQTVARNHFNCDRLVGGRLDEADGNCIGSHWHERHWHGSLLGPALSGISENSLSPITLALLEDSGWYKVNYRNVKTPAFGVGAGCDFVENECINNDKVPDWATNEFCAAPFRLSSNGVVDQESLNNVFCDPAYQSFAICDLSDLLSPLERTYFSDPSLSPLLFELADSCPLPVLGLGLDCRIDDPYEEFYRGESVGENSRCLNAFYQNSVGTAHRPACMQITCDAEAGVVRVGQGDLQQVCTYDGQLLPADTDEGTGATIECPRLAAVCPEIFTCPDGCSGVGDCIIPDRANASFSEPFCECFDESNTDPSCAPPTAMLGVSRTPTAAPSRVAQKGPPLLSSASTNDQVDLGGGAKAASGDGSAKSAWTALMVCTISALSLPAIENLVYTF